MACPGSMPRMMQAPSATLLARRQMRAFTPPRHKAQCTLQRPLGASSRCRQVRASADAGDAALLEEIPEPEDARGAISVGLDLYNAGQYDAALGVFEKALSLPGTGLKQFRDKPPAISNGEKQAALYNIACCYSRQGNLENSLRALATCLEAGYEDFNQILADPDLEAARTDARFKNLEARFNKGSGTGFFGSLLKGFQL